MGRISPMSSTVIARRLSDGLGPLYRGSPITGINTVAKAISGGGCSAVREAVAKLGLSIGNICSPGSTAFGLIVSVNGGTTAAMGMSLY